MRYVVAYDVPDDRRRLKLAKCLDGYGDRVQGSVFEAALDGELLEKMMANARKLLNEAEDRFAVYPLCATCAGKAVRLGLGEVPPGDEEVFIV